MWPPICIRSMNGEPWFLWPLPVLNPAGEVAQAIATLSWVLFAMGGAVFAIVMLLLAVALFGGPQGRAWLAKEKAVVIGGLAFPIVVLTGVLIYGLAVTSRLTEAPGPDDLRIRVVGEMWWWRVSYLEDGREVAVTANEIHIPVGEPVVFELESADVIHSFWIPRLGGKMDMIPGRTNILRLRADEPGVFIGQCAEFCGGPHALMGLMVVAQPAEAFQGWLSRQAAPAAVPDDPFRARGWEVFVDSGCGACHTVRGTEANGLLGPDLTHIGARRQIGSGILPNNRGTLAGWIANSQNLKPGNLMPNYHVLSGADLHALAAYLEGLR